MGLFDFLKEERKEVIVIEPFRDSRINGKYRYKVRTKDRKGTTYSGTLLAQAMFPEIGQMIKPEEWTSVEADRAYREDWQNMYGRKSVSQTFEMPKIGEVCVDISKGDGEFSIYLGMELFLVLPALSDESKMCLESFDYLDSSDFKDAYITVQLRYDKIFALGYVLKSSRTLELFSESADVTGDAKIALNLTIRNILDTRPEAVKQIDKMAEFNKLWTKQEPQREQDLGYPMHATKLEKLLKHENVIRQVSKGVRSALAYYTQKREQVEPLNGEPVVKLIRGALDFNTAEMSNYNTDVFTSEGNCFMVKCSREQFTYTIAGMFIEKSKADIRLSCKDISGKLAACACVLDTSQGWELKIKEDTDITSEADRKLWQMFIGDTQTEQNSKGTSNMDAIRQAYKDLMGE